MPEHPAGLILEASTPIAELLLVRQSERGSERSCHWRRVATASIAVAPGTDPGAMMVLSSEPFHFLQCHV